MTRANREDLRKLKRAAVKLGAVGPEDWEEINSQGAWIFGKVLAVFYLFPVIVLAILGGIWYELLSRNPMVVVICVVALGVSSMVGVFVGNQAALDYTEPRINANFAKKYAAVDEMSDDEIDREIDSGQPSVWRTWKGNRRHPARRD